MEVHEYYNVCTLNQDFDEMWINTAFCSDGGQPPTTLIYDPTLTVATTHPATTTYHSLSLSTPEAYSQAMLGPNMVPTQPLFFQPSQLCAPIAQSATHSPPTVPIQFECNLSGPHFLSQPLTTQLGGDPKMGLLPSHLHPHSTYLSPNCIQPCTSLQQQPCFSTGITLEQLNPVPLNEISDYPTQFNQLPIASINTVTQSGYDTCSPTSSSESSLSTGQSDVSSVSSTKAAIRGNRKRTIGRNQLGRAFSPGIPLSLSERQFIVRLYQEGWRICDISRRLAVTHSCVSKILQRYRKTGSVKPKDAKEGRPEGPLVTAIRDYYKRLGIYSQTEIRAQLLRDGLCTRDSLPSRSSINHILRTKFDIRKRRGTQEK